MLSLIPNPVFTRMLEGIFELTPSSVITVQPIPDEAATREVTAIGQFLADKINPATGFNIRVHLDQADDHLNKIALSLSDDPALGDEGYHLNVSSKQITLTAHCPAGLFWGVQTLRQLLPHAIELTTPQPGPWTVPAVDIRDLPRFAWRGVMLDVARHFFGVEEVKRYIDLAAAYKFNRFHLHLTDDQGWRLMIHSWPNLTRIGGTTEVGGGAGGYFTQAEYAELVAYAHARYMILIPEIDMPGHTNAALASYPELNHDGKAPDLYTGIQVGFSSLDANKEFTYQFIDEVVGEVAALTPGPYLHIGGDEAAAMPPADYVHFIQRVQEIVTRHGKTMIGWEEITRTPLRSDVIVQLWHNSLREEVVKRQGPVILSPASKCYLDMKYDPATPLGQNWAGYIDVETGYSWDPITFLPGLKEDNILGIEAPIWTETLETIQDVEFMAFPRLPGYAEIGWSPAAGRNWEAYRQRLGAHGPRLSAMNVKFFPAPQIPWAQD